MSLVEKIAGAWSLVRWETRAPDGAVSLPYGENLTGLLVFTASGYMSGQIMVPDAEDLAPGPNLIAGSQRYIAYCGPFQFDEGTMTLTTTVMASVSRSWVGSEQVRRVELDGDKLVLRPPQRPSGEQAVIEWRRL